MGKNQVFSLNPEPGVLVCGLMDSAKKLHLAAEKSEELAVIFVNLTI